MAKKKEEEKLKEKKEKNEKEKNKKETVKKDTKKSTSKKTSKKSTKKDKIEYVPFFENRTTTGNVDLSSDFEEIIYKPSRSPIYIGYTFKKVFRLFMSLILLCIGSFWLYKSFITGEAELVSYNESLTNNYEVYYKKTDIDYDITKALPKNMTYIASFIDRIKVDFKYKFDINNQDKTLLTDCDFTYSIKGKLSIDSNTNKPYYDKEFTFLTADYTNNNGEKKTKKVDSKVVSMKHNNKYTITEHLDLDYAYYNKIAVDFANKTGINGTAYLNIYMVVTKKNSNESFTLSGNNQASLTIPLSQKTLDIKFNESNGNKHDTLISNAYTIIGNRKLFSVSIVLLFISLIYFYLWIKIAFIKVAKSSKYDKLINKILKEYDRLIVETESLPILDKKEIVRVNKFTELLDVRDNLKVPIMYVEIAKHQKCMFYINHNYIVYEYIIKSIDLED